MVQWEHVLGHCPNLVDPSGSTYKVKIPYWRSTITDEWDSLADMWSDWNLQYVNADFPRLIVRFEDLLFNAEYVMKKIKECAGIPENGKPYEYLTEEAKDGGNTGNFISSVIKYGTELGRYSCLTEQDTAYLKSALDSNLMDKFHYLPVPDFFSSFPPGGLCPGQKTATTWLDKRATQTKEEYIKDIRKHPWRRPDMFPDDPNSLEPPGEKCHKCT